MSYKDRAARSDDRADVLLLREVVKDPERFSDCIVGADKLCGPGDKIVSAFRVCGTDCGVPPVLKRQPRGNATA